MSDEGILLDQINAAVAAEDEARKAVETATSELVSRGKLIGQLLLEAKKLHPKVADFEAFLKRVNGLHLSRAYDLMRLAGGRVTDEELRQDARERQQKSREKRKIPKSEPEPISVTDPVVTETQEASDEWLEELPAAEEASAEYLLEFKLACDNYLPKMTELDRREALLFVQDWLRALEMKKRAA
jgi:hypothetical protein